MDNYSQIANLTTSAQPMVMPERIGVSPAVKQRQAIFTWLVPKKSTRGNNEHISINSQAVPRIHQRIKWASVALAIFGLAIMGYSFIIAIPLLSSVLAIAGISVVLVAILFYYVSPARLIDSDLYNASVVSSISLTNSLLRPVAGEARSIYVPSSRVGSTKVFIPTNNESYSNVFASGTDIINISDSGKNGFFLTPPGYGLYEYARKLGANFTEEGMEHEIRDTIVKGLELASSVNVARHGDVVSVHLYDVVGSSMCHTLRQKDSRACCQVGCPICSCISCMVVESTDRRAMVMQIKANGKSLDLTYKLL
jgi:hypothetical protein